VTLRVYAITGQVVSELVSGEQQAGHYTATWDGRTQAGVPVASGVYLYELRAGSFRSVQKMLLMK
jgi:flagellar hook assembly protein FlgD